MRLIVAIKNSGKVRLVPGRGHTLVQTPPSGLIDPTVGTEDQWTNYQRIEHALIDDEVEIEPGECEEYCYDVGIPDHAEHLQIHTCLACAPRSRSSGAGEAHGDPNMDQTLHWDATSLIDLAALKRRRYVVTPPSGVAANVTTTHHSG